MRQVDCERRALAGLRRQVDEPAMLTDDAFDDRQPQTGAAANVLRREEGLENHRRRRSVHARSRIADG